MKVIITRLDNDQVNLTINNIFIGQLDRADLRHIIEQVDKVAND